MDFGSSRSLGFQENPEVTKITANKTDNVRKLTYKIDGSPISEPSAMKAENLFEEKTGRSLKAKVLSRVFSEDYGRVKKMILDPRGTVMRRWNKIFIVASIISLFVDPLFFYLPRVRVEVCTDIVIHLEVILTVIRSMADVFYIIQILVRFRTAYVAPSSRVFGRGELVIDPSKIASRYLRKGFWLDLVAALPIPQVLIWAVIPNLSGSAIRNTKNVLRFIILFQYLPRVFLTFPLSLQIIKDTGVVTKTAWVGATYNMVLYLLASYVMGSCWYLLSIERAEACWNAVCVLQNTTCQKDFFDCKMIGDSGRVAWFDSSNITTLCDPSNGFYQFGIYGDATTYGVTTAMFLNRCFYGLWWGTKTLVCIGQNLMTSNYVGENLFAIQLSIVGLVLFASLIASMQTYLQSTTLRLEQWRVKKTDTEQWMRHRQLPQELRQCVRRYNQYKWVATRGVDEEAILQGLPKDLRRKIKRHLCLNLVRGVPLFDQMDEQMLDAICDRLKPTLGIQGTCLVREGDPINEMVFIIRGHLNSYTTDGGRNGFFNSCQIGPGDFCGEELLTWALDPRLSAALPSSTRTVEAVSEVEGFVLTAEDLQFVALQFRRLHSKQLRHKFRFYSHQWRTWAACFIQGAWRRFKRRKNAAELMMKAKDSPMTTSTEPAFEEMELFFPQPGSGFAVYAARLTTSIRSGGSNCYGSDSVVVSSLQKPPEPDFMNERNTIIG